jgi:hypothetical protein
MSCDKDGSTGWGWVGAKGASQYLRKSMNTLQKWRTNRVGPPWSKNGGHVMYKLSDLDQWLESQKVVGSSDAPGGDLEEDFRSPRQETAKKSDRWWEEQ